MDPAKPSPELLRGLTDEHVLSALMRRRLMTRAELAAETGLSKPTTGESVRRLVQLGLVVDTGERSAGGRGRGRVGSYYALAADVGAALAVCIAPEGIVVEGVDAYGETLVRAEEKIDRPAGPEAVAAAVVAAAERARGRVGGSIRLVVVSAAGPVDRSTGRLVHVADEPFLIGELDPTEILAPYASGPVVVDNDVNWAARAERDHRDDHGAPRLRDFAYVFLGEGLGCAIVSDGQVMKGHTGMAGEISHVVTSGRDGRATPLIDVFEQLDLRQPGSTAIDVDRLVAAVTDEQGGAAVRRTLGQALGGTLAAIAALADPETVVVGGPWGMHPVVLETINASAGDLPRRLEVRAAQLTVEPSLTGARAAALGCLRKAIVAAATSASSTAL
ncbi:ROK family transcriptional regulator [Actinopolymorpha sp. NPDC004070]|uniref:ROK family transcriptional regulator n=1 Tax=Actinopolymorpha sp. NPDC004070 TaxID=3154548 RepID=UPI0033B44736